MLVAPTPDIGGQLSPLLIPHTQPCVPLKPGFWKGTPQAYLPASSQTQCGFSLLSASRSHLCSKVGWSTLCSIGWQMRQTASRWVQPIKDREKPTKIKGLPLLWVVQVQLGLMKSCFIQKHTHTKHNKIIRWYKPDDQVHVWITAQHRLGFSLPSMGCSKSLYPYWNLLLKSSQG